MTAKAWRHRARAASTLGASGAFLAALAVTTAVGCGDGGLAGPQRNHPPRFASVKETVYHDVEYRQQITVSDPDGDPVSIQAVAVPAWLTCDTTTMVLHGVPGVERIGKHQVTLVASDGSTSATLSFELEVRPHLSVLSYEGPWLEAGFSFGHDGEPWVGDHVTVYSGFSSQAARQSVADALERHFTDYQTTFDLGGLEILDGWNEGTTIPVLTLRYQGTDVLWSGQSYRYGVIVHAPDSPRYAQEGYTPALYDQLLRHELMHVLEYYLVGQDGTYTSVEKWFHEGMGMVMGGTPPTQIRTAATLRAWQQDMQAYPGQGNPIDIKSGSDYPAAIQNDAVQLGRYYLAFELAVRYLLDPAGAGKTPLDVKAMYLSIRNGASFEDAFSQTMGFSVESYEADFFALMAQYLG